MSRCGSWGIPYAWYLYGTASLLIAANIAVITLVNQHLPETDGYMVGIPSPDLLGTRRQSQHLERHS